MKLFGLGLFQQNHSMSVYGKVFGDNAVLKENTGALFLFYIKDIKTIRKRLIYCL